MFCLGTPRERSLSTTTRPMKPAPPVTMMRWDLRSVGMRGNCIRGRPGFGGGSRAARAGQQGPAAPRTLGRVLRAILTILTWASVLIAAAVLGAWAFGRVVTDSRGWSQFIWWLPSPGAVVVVAAELALAWLFAGWARRAGSAESSGETP